MIVYKKVMSVKLNGESYYTSAYMRSHGLQLKYGLGDKVVPVEPTRIFAFDTKDHADHWFSPLYGEQHVLECETTDDNVVKAKDVIIARVGSCSSLDFWIKAWKAIRFGASSCSWPEGTILVPWLKPIRLVS